MIYNSSYSVNDLKDFNSSTITIKYKIKNDIS